MMEAQTGIGLLQDDDIPISYDELPLGEDDALEAVAENVEKSKGARPMHQKLALN